MSTRGSSHRLEGAALTVASYVAIKCSTRRATTRATSRPRARRGARQTPSPRARRARPNHGRGGHCGRARGGRRRRCGRSSSTPADAARRRTTAHSANRRVPRPHFSPPLSLCRHARANAAPAAAPAIMRNVARATRRTLGAGSGSATSAERRSSRRPVLETAACRMRGGGARARRAAAVASAIAVCAAGSFRRARYCSPACDRADWRSSDAPASTRGRAASHTRPKLDCQIAPSEWISLISWPRSAGAVAVPAAQHNSAAPR